MCGIDACCFRVDQDVFEFGLGVVFQAFVEDDVILFRNHECRMSADGEVHVIITGVFYVPGYGQGSAGEFLGYGEGKIERVDFLGFFGRYQAVYGFVFGVFDALEFVVAGEAMLTHRVFDSFMGVEATVYFSDEREQDRCVAVPEGRIADPDCLTVCRFVIDAAKFCAVIADLHAQVFVFHGSHVLISPCVIFYGLFWIDETGIINSVQDFIQVFFAEVVGHGEVHVQVVSAVFRRCARNFAFKIADEFIHFGDERDDVSGGVVSCQQQVETGAAAHWTEVYGFVFPLLMVTEEGGSEVLDGVDFSGVHDGLIVWGGHSQVEGGDDAVTHMIFS